VRAFLLLPVVAADFFFIARTQRLNCDMCTHSFKDPIPETNTGACGDAPAHISPLLDPALASERKIRVSDVLTLLIHSILSTAVLVFVSRWQAPA
jgi:hypothetical protein